MYEKKSITCVEGREAARNQATQSRLCVSLLESLHKTIFIQQCCGFRPPYWLYTFTTKMHAKCMQTKGQVGKEVM